MVTTPNLGVRLMATNDVQKEVIFNEAAVLFDTLVARTAISRTNNPPVSPNMGDCYIVGTAGTGAFSGQENKIALYFNGWRFYQPSQKMKFFIADTSTFWTYSGTSWAQDPAGTPMTLDDLTNVGGATPTDGQVLTFDAENNLWVPQDPPAAKPLSELPDVEIDDLTSGQVLVWDADDEKWKNATLSTGGGGASSLADLSDVEMAGVGDGKVLTWDGASSRAMFKTLSWPTLQLSSLTDINLNGAQAGDVLAFNGAAWGPSPAVITYSFLGMVDGPQTFEGYANHFLAVDPTESYLEFRSLQSLIDELDDFKLADLTDVQNPADAHVGKVLTLAKTSGQFHYTYAELPNWAVEFKAVGEQVTTRIRSLDFYGFTIEETSDGHIKVTNTNALTIQVGGENLSEPVSAINFTGDGIGTSFEEGVLTVTFDVPEAAINLGELNDVDLDTLAPFDGAVLRYQASNQKWVPSYAGGGGPVDGSVEPALYEYGPFAPPTPAMLPARHNAPSAVVTLVKNRGLFVQPGPQTSGIQHAIVGRNLPTLEVPWMVTARIIPSSFQVSGHAAGIVMQRQQNNAFVFLALSNANSDTQYQLRLGTVNASGTETVILTEPNFYPWLRLAFDGDYIRAYVSAEGLVWHPFGSPIDPAPVLAGAPNRIGITNRSNQTHTGQCGALVTYWDDPEFPAVERVEQGVVALHLHNIVDVDMSTPPEDGQALIWDEELEAWRPGTVSGEGGGGGGGSADYPDMEGHEGSLLRVKTTGDEVEWKTPAEIAKQTFSALGPAPVELVQVKSKIIDNDAYAVTFDAAPTEGNWLIAIGTWQNYGLNPTSGWTQVAEAVNGSRILVKVAVKQAGSGESATQEAFSSFGEFGGYTVLEVAAAEEAWEDVINTLVVKSDGLFPSPFVDDPVPVPANALSVFAVITRPYGSLAPSLGSDWEVVHHETGWGNPNRDLAVGVNASTTAGTVTPDIGVGHGAISECGYVLLVFNPQITTVQRGGIGVEDLKNVDLPGEPADGAVIVWDADEKKWKEGTAGGVDYGGDWIAPTRTYTFYSEEDLELLTWVPSPGTIQAESGPSAGEASVLRMPATGHNSNSVGYMNIKAHDLGEDVNNLSVRLKVSSEYDYDRFEVMIDDEVVYSISGNGTWHTWSTVVSPGTHQLKFRYRKDGSQSHHDDTGYVSQIILLGEGNVHYRKGVMVSHNGRKWLCLVEGTLEEPGEGTDWEPISTGALVDLNDVDMSIPPQDGEALVYEAASQKWVPGSAGGGAASEFDISAFIAGEADGDAVLMRFIASRAFTIAAGMPNSFAYADTAPTDETVFSVEKNGTPIGTLTFDYGSNTGTFELSSAVSFSAGDRLTIVTPVYTNDIADIAITIAGSRA